MEKFKYMKNLLLSIFLLISSVCFSQIRSFEAEYINVKTYNTEIQQFDEWGGWHKSGVIVTISDKVIKIYSQVQQEYIIISVIQEKSVEKGTLKEMDAIDINGSRITIDVVNWYTGEIYMYIRWTNLQLAYKIRKL